MTDNQLDVTEDQEDAVLLNKVDSMLHKHRLEQWSLILRADQQIEQRTPISSGVLQQATTAMNELSEVATAENNDNEIPVLTDQIALTIDAWPAQTEISELLYFAFDAALEEAQISLDPAKRLTFIRALRKRLPKNI
ncbi:hypothetical protein Nstercoris_01360 [Nitrosomonas stercoris]|uniref:Uncharacterized protein n=1 Tax=Nitrosomonas stercoris TaxID=1444684 RepID=A0A4Y1YM60_9PROT|nr:hypothetical protein Nstercoris_01360 [Nitrosomonas stercoris]